MSIIWIWKYNFINLNHPYIFINFLVVFSTYKFPLGLFYLRKL